MRTFALTGTIRVARRLLPAVLLTSLWSAAAPAAEPLITQHIDESSLVTLSGNTRPEMTAVNDRGAVSDSKALTHIYLQLKRSDADEAAALQLVEDLHDRSSAQYHKWLSAAQVAARFGPNADDVAAISSWLTSHGFTVHHVYAENGVIDFSGTAGAVREAFHTEIHNLVVKGKAHIANAGDPRIPAALAPAISGIVSLNDFRPQPQFMRRTSLNKPNYNTGNPSFPEVLVPGDLQTIYDATPLYDHGVSGQGQTIVVVEDTDLYSANDWYVFRQTFGLDKQFPHGSLGQSNPQPNQWWGGGAACADPGVNPDDVEAVVDVEWASAAAPNAHIQLISCADTEVSFGGHLAMQNLLTNGSRLPQVISVSYGVAESLNGAAYNAYVYELYELAVLEGVSVFVSSGDGNADISDYNQGQAPMSGTSVNGWGSTPFNVSVGGTDFSDTATGTNATYWAANNNPNYSSALSYIPEMTWNDTCASGVTAQVLGFATTYGPNGLCNYNSQFYYINFPDLGGGSGGQSACAYGAPTIQGVTGGTCRGYQKPSYQTGVFGNPRDGVRDLPDVSLFASNGWWGHYYVLCFTDTVNYAGYAVPSCSAVPPSAWPGAGGTSFASPILAAYQSLIDQTAGGFQGNPNYVYYALANEEYGRRGDSACNASAGNAVGHGCIFHDVTLGDIDNPCVPFVANGTTVGSFNCYYDGALVGVMSQSNKSFQPTFPTTPGYDLATGLGSVDVTNLVRAWPGARLGW
jgi:subtilase family serine protease